MGLEFLEFDLAGVGSESHQLGMWKERETSRDLLLYLTSVEPNTISAKVPRRGRLTTGPLTALPCVLRLRSIEDVVEDLNRLCSLGISGRASREVCRVA